MPGHPNDSFADLSLYEGPWETAEITHLLKRTMFGARREDVRQLRGKTVRQAVDSLLENTEPLPAPPVNDYDQLGIQGVAWGKTWVNTPFVLADDQDRLISIWKRTFECFIKQGISLREKMTLFLHNHFATVADMNRSDMIWAHHRLLRTYALGNFKELVKKVTLDCQMLRFLNGEINSRTAPNENYARELQELFCLGAGSGYNESDVKQAARVLTGWKVNYDTGYMYFEPDDHDTTDKQFSAFYGQRIIKGRTGETGALAELDDLLDMIFSQPATARFICRKLYRWFVYYHIDENTENKIIIPLADLFRQNDFEIKPVLSALFSSSHFYAENNRAVQVKSPVDFCVGMLREFAVPLAPDERFDLNNSLYSFLAQWSGKMGQLYAYPPNVSGWPAYYQAPGFYQLWLNGSTYPKRNEFSRILIDHGINRDGFVFAVDVLRFAQSLQEPGDPDALISESLDILYSIPVDGASRRELKKNILLGGQEQDHYWTDAWNAFLSDKQNENSRAIVETRLKNLYRFIVNSPEYQLT